MTRRSWPLVLALAVLLLTLGATSFTGGFGLFHAPAFQTEVALPQPVVPTGSPAPSQSSMTCPNKTADPVVYYANDPLASQYNDFGRPLDPSLSPLNEPHGSAPDVHQIVTASWNRFCHDPALTRAVVAAAFPNWNGLNRTFDWPAALSMLNHIDWGHAELVYYTTPPNPWTMMMVHSPTGGIPTTYITPARHAGWYLRLAVDSSHTLLIRPGCGDQPSLNLTQQQGYSQAALTRFFRVS